ncbi:tetratricopeptide repeat protein [Dapis sp. BLCC M229]|uniref:tetratricopeptide repeat protein n=1 Tax=Dapis sp. BLCC M229 TaxID=3400188 RepID=UPI003CF90B44
MKPDNALYYGSRGALYFQQQKYKEAIVDLTEGMRLQPEDARFYYFRAKVYYQSKEKEKAREDFKKAAALYKQKGNTEEYNSVMEELEKIQQQKNQNAESPEYYKKLGDELSEQGDHEAAIKDYTLGLTKANLAGVGVGLGETKLRGKLGLQITEVLKNSPAFKANLKSDDIILEADGKLLLSDKTDTLLSLIDGGGA